MTEEQRDSLLIEMSENIKTINNVLEKHSEELVNLRQNMERMEHELTEKIDKNSKEIVCLGQNMERMEKELTEKIDKNSKEIVCLGQNMERMEKELTEKIDKNSKEIVRLRKNTAKMEYELTDKIMALFDLGEVNKDKFEETDLRTKGIENTLDWHDRRLMKLEMTD